MSAIQIDKNVPLPKKANGRLDHKYPFRQMKVGDSFLYPEGVSPTAAYHVARYHSLKMQVQFTVRKTPEGFRCWRVE